MIKNTFMLRSELKKYANPDMKIKRMVTSGELIPIVKGIYETDKFTNGQYLSSIIYGPSYLSFEYALSYYSLIPEAVYNFTSATFEKKRTKQYATPFGVYAYRDVPSKAYPMEIVLKIENGYSYQIATPEKAICDMLYKTSPLKNLRGIRYFLFEDLRIDIDDFYSLNLEKMASISSLYSTSNHKLLRSLLKKGKING
ncbi:MAG: hypothetical protein R3Y09_12210 [Clostridia bacterium]